MEKQLAKISGNGDMGSRKIKWEKTVHALFLVILLFPISMPSGASAMDAFRWGEATKSGVASPAASGQILKLTDEHPVTVFISFRVRADVTRVRFAIAREDRDDGVTLLEETVKVHGGIATSRLLLDMHIGVPLGRHDLYIRAFDAVKDEQIQTGRIPYILLPSGTECMCQVVPNKSDRKNTNKRGGIGHA